MKRLLDALVLGAFALGAATVLAGNDAKPLSKMDTEQARAAKAAAKARWDAMTPEQQAAARKVARNKKLTEATALDMIANSQPVTGDFGAPGGWAYKPTPKEREEQTRKALEASEKARAERELTK